MKITQKKAKEILISKKNLLLDIQNKKVQIENININNVNEIVKSKKDELRTCKKIQTNAIMFDNQSWIYFDDGKKEYYNNGNILIIIYVWYDEYAKKEFYKSLIYWIE